MCFVTKIERNQHSKTPNIKVTMHQSVTQNKQIPSAKGFAENRGNMRPNRSHR